MGPTSQGAPQDITIVFQPIAEFRLAFLGYANYQDIVPLRLGGHKVPRWKLSDPI